TITSKRGDLGSVAAHRALGAAIARNKVIDVLRRYGRHLIYYYKPDALLGSGSHSLARGESRPGSVSAFSWRTAPANWLKLITFTTHDHCHLTLDIIDPMTIVAILNCASRVLM